MEQQGFALQIEAMRRRVQRLYRESNVGALEHELLPDALEELEIALDELRTLEDELHHQQTRLLDEREAVESERQSYQDLFETAPVGYLVTRLDGTIRKVNQTAATILGVSEQQLVGRAIGLFIPDGERRLFRVRVAEVPQSNEPSVWEISMLRGDGSAFEVSLTVGVVRGKLGKPLALRWIVQDVSERKQLEAQLRERIGELEQQVGDLLAVAGAQPTERTDQRPALAARGDAQERFAVFADASMQLFAALDGPTTLERVVRMLVPALADLCILDLVGEDGVHRLALTDGGPGVRRNYPSQPDPPTSGDAPATAQAQLIVQLGDARLNAIGRDAVARKLLRSLVPASCVIAPLQLRGRTFGALTFVSSIARRCYGADDLALFSELARRASIALDRAQPV